MPTTDERDPPREAKKFSTSVSPAAAPGRTVAAPHPSVITPGQAEGGDWADAAAQPTGYADQRSQVFAETW